MALVIDDRVRETTTVTGTSDAILLGAVTGFQAFSAIGSGNTTYYTISDQSGGNWEVGLGTYSSVGPTLARTTVLSSSNSGAKVSFPAGTKDVFVTYPSEKAVYLDASGNITPASIGPLTVTSLTDSGLTATRVTYATTGGLLTDDADLTFDGTTLTSGGYSTGGNLTFTGTGNRITGDFSNATVANRVAFQTSTANSATVVAAIPNGTNTLSAFSIFNNANPTNAANLSLLANGNTDTSIRSSITGTGTYLPLTMYTGGSERLRIDTSGNVGIGTSSPPVASGYTSLAINNATNGGFLDLQKAGTAYVRLEIDGSNNATIGTGAGTTTAIRLQTNNTERMRIDSSGNVGIGTSSPTQKLTLSVADGGGISLGDRATVGTFLIGRTAGGALTGNTTSIGFQQAGTAGGNITYNAYYDGTGGGNQIFSTAGTERMRIDSSGNVGIGTDNPPARLSVAGTFTGGAFVASTFANLGLTSGSTVRINFLSGEDGTVGRTRAIIEAVSTAANNGELAFQTRSAGSVTERMRITSTGEVGLGSSATNRLSLTYDGSSGVATVGPNSTGGSTILTLGTSLSGTYAERMRIDSSGNVGIGTSSPAQKLEIVGGSYQMRLGQGGAVGVYDIGRSTTTGIFNFYGYQTGTVAYAFGGVDGERMRIDAAGNVLIGSSAVASNTLRYLDVYNTDTGAAAGAIIRLITSNAAASGNTTVDIVKYKNGIFAINNNETNSAAYTAFAIGGSERMRIDSAGNVGIGTSSPAVKLDINGLMRAAGWSLSGGVVSGGTTAFSAGTVTTDANWGYYFRTGTGSSTIAEYSFRNAADTERMRIDSSGNLLVGTTGLAGIGGFSISPNSSAGAAAVFWNRTSTTISSYVQDFRNGGTTVGYISYTDTAVTYATSSDYRLKENIAPMTGALDVVQQLKPVTYNWKANGSSGQGFIAHELQAVVPDCVTGEKDAVDAEGNPVYQGIDVSFLVATLTASIQELKAIVDAQAERIAILEAK